MKAIAFTLIGLGLTACSSGDSEYPTCANLVDDITELAKEKNKVEVIEVNNIKTIHASGSWLKCTASAVTDRGDVYLEYEVETSEQGKQILSVKFS